MVFCHHRAKIRVLDLTLNEAYLVLPFIKDVWVIFVRSLERQVMKNMFTAKKIKTAIIFVGVIVVIMVCSLYLVEMRGVEGSEEAGMALWGFPFPMVESGPFYARYGRGRDVNPRRPEDIRQQPGALDNPTLLGSGIILNFVCYGSLGLILMPVGKTIISLLRE